MDTYGIPNITALTLSPEQCADMDWSDLPETARLLAEVMGKLGAARFILRYAGRSRIYVSGVDHMTAAHPLVLLLGLEDARKLAAYANGSCISVPNSKAFMAKLLYRYIMRERQAGRTWPEIQEGLVVEARFTERRLQQIAATGGASKRKTRPVMQQGELV